MTLNQGNKTKHIAKGRTEKDDMTMQVEKNSMKHKVPLCLIIIVGQTLMEINLKRKAFVSEAFLFCVYRIFKLTRIFLSQS
ncbi:hypothetical protein MUB16_18875 [Priestia sp. OVL9]|nr:hypothetical protein [Priestia sp. OVL9]